jgi:hypothetical protein
MVYSVNMELQCIVLMEEAVLVEQCRVLDGLTNNMTDFIIINIAEET